MLKQRIDIWPMSKKGFTLIELLIVVSVLALLASIVFSNLGGAREGARISNALSFQSQTHSLLGSDLVGWWNFNEGSGTTARDISGYDNHGTIVGATHTDGVTGTGGSALSFNESSHYVDVGNITTIAQNGPATIGGWFKFNQFAREKENFIGIHTQLYQHSSNDYFYLGGGGADYFSIGRFLSINTWYHIVLTYNGTHETALLYVDGKKYNVTIQTSNTNHSSLEPFRIGRFGGNYFDGLIDDVRIYSRVLTAQEIQTLYAQTKDNYLAENE